MICVIQIIMLGTLNVYTCHSNVLNHVRLSVTSWTVACQAPLSVGCSRQEYWSGLPCPFPRDHPDPGIEPTYVSCICYIGRGIVYQCITCCCCCCCAKSLQSCPILCDPIDCSPPSSPVPGILQARTLEWVAISFSNACKWKAKVKSLSRVWLLATP